MHIDLLHQHRTRAADAAVMPQLYALMVAMSKREEEWDDAQAHWEPAQDHPAIDLPHDEPCPECGGTGRTRP